MSAADLEFTPVLSPRPSGIHKSGLFHHLMRTGNICIAQFTKEGDGSITRVSRPSDMLLPGRKYILLHLDPKLITVDLFKYLPKETRDRYSFGKLKLHITVDQEYGDKGTRHAEEQLLWYSHITLQATVGNNKYLACHIYIDDGIVRGVFIKEPDINAYCPKGELISKAYELVEKPLEIISAAIQHMQKERDSLEVQLTKKLSMLYNINISSSLSKERLDKLLEEAKDLQYEIRIYSEGYYANQFQHAERFVREKRAGTVRFNALSVDSVVLEATTGTGRGTPGLQEQTADTESVLVGSFGSQSSTLLSVPFSPSSFRASISVSPLPEMLAQESLSEHEKEKILLKSLKSRYDELKKKAKEYQENKLKGTRLEQVYKYYEALQELVVDVAAADICASEKYQAVASTLNSYTKQLFSKEILDCYMQQLNVAGVKKFFGEFKSQLDWKFYLTFQIRIMRADLTDAEENNAVEICEFFFKHDSKYRDCLSGTYKSYVNDDGEEVSILSIVGLIWREKPRTKLFSCMVKHSGAQRLEGFISKDKHAAPLLFVACACSVNDDFREVISALLETAHPSLEIETSLFAAGVETRLIDVYGSTASTGNEKYDICNDAFHCTPYMGSALYAYMTSNDVNLDIISSLAKETSTMHLMLSFARFCSWNTQQLNYGSKEKHGIDIGKEVVVTEKIRLAQDHAVSGANYYSCLIGSDNPELFSMLEVLYLELKSRLARITETELNSIIVILQQNAEHFRDARNNEMTPSCYQAILYFCMYLAPSAYNHKLIVTTCMDLCDADISAKRAKGISETDLLAKRTAGYAEAMKFVDNSIYRDALKDLATSSRVTAVLGVQSSTAKTLSLIKS